MKRFGCIVKGINFPEYASSFGKTQTRLTISPGSGIVAIQRRGRMMDRYCT
jgi:hypothetical protein